MELDKPSEVARRRFIQSIYPKKHPFNFPTEESLQRIKRQDLIDFKAKHYRPDTTVLALVGDSLIKLSFDDWQVSGKPPTLKYPPVSLPEKIDRILMNEVYGLDKVELHSLTNKIHQVNLAQVNQAARELLHPDKIVIVTAGSSIKIKN
jgi:predicted Zn-dependent peptidase